MRETTPAKQPRSVPPAGRVVPSLLRQLRWHLPTRYNEQAARTSDRTTSGDALSSRQTGDSDGHAATGSWTIAGVSDACCARLPDVHARDRASPRGPDPLTKPGSPPGPMQCGKFARVAPVGLDPLARLSRDQRRSHHRTLVPKPGELSLNAIAARAGFIAEPKFAVSAGQLRDQRFHRRRRIGDLPVSRISPRMPASARATTIVSLCTSSPTYVVLFPMTRLLCMRLGAGPPGTTLGTCIL